MMSETLSRSCFYLLLGMRNMFDCIHPCPCGNYLEPQKTCTCAPAVVTKYQKRISGPILDRIDIHIEVPRVDYEKLSSDRLGETSASMRALVSRPREISKQSDFRITVPILSAMQICGLGRSGSFAGCRTRVRG